MVNTSAEASRFQNAQTRNFSYLSCLACGPFVVAILDINSFLITIKIKDAGYLNFLPHCVPDSLLQSVLCNTMGYRAVSLQLPLEILYTLSSMN